MGAIALLKQVPVLPKEAGLLVTTPQRAQEFISERERLYEEEFGSCTLKDMGAKKKRKRDAAQKERERIDGEKEKRELKKADAANKKLELELGYAKCKPECTCGAPVGECPMAKFIKCETCNEIKKGLCKVRACVAERKEQPEILMIEAPNH